jgi:PAS domain S-box-containing protein
LLKDVESGQRGFLITGDEAYLDLHQKAAEAIPGRLADLRLLTQDSPVQQQALANLESLINRRLTILADGIQLKRDKASEVSLVKMLAGGKEVADLIRAQVDQMRANENELLRQRSAQLEYDATLTNQLIVFANLTALTLLVVTAWMLYREIIKRTKAEQALSQSNAFLNSLIENIPNMIFVKDAKDLRFVRFNKAGEDLLGYSRQDLIGKNDYDFFPKEEADFFIAKDRAVLTHGDLVDIPEEPIHTRLRGVRTLHTMKIPIVDAQGKPQYLLGISEDITARKETDQEIQRLNHELMTYTAQLEVTNRELESFSYTVSHDLRAPLRAIDGFAKMLEEDYAKQISDDGRRWLTVIRDNSRRMSQLIDDLLGFSRMGRKPLEAVALDMTAIVREVKVEMGEAAFSPRVEVRISPLGKVRADRSLIKQVWANLLSNAVKYSGLQSEPLVEVFQLERDGETIYGVRDNGVGFDMRYYEKLFGVFERLHSDQEFSGTGVGLAIVQRIVVRHGGRVWAESKLNEGATFYFTLGKKNGSGERETA